MRPVAVLGHGAVQLTDVRVLSHFLKEASVTQAAGMSVGLPAATAAALHLLAEGFPLQERKNIIIIKEEKEMKKRKNGAKKKERKKEKASCEVLKDKNLLHEAGFRGEADTFLDAKPQTLSRKCQFLSK